MSIQVWAFYNKGLCGMRTLALLFFSIFSGLSFAVTTSPTSTDSQFIPKSYREPSITKPKLNIIKVAKTPTKKQPLKKKNDSVKHAFHRDHLSYATLYQGSLRANVSRIARQYGWRDVIWKLPEDYRWLGKARISGNGLPGIFKKLLVSYPVQADFYPGNHVIVMVPRML